MKDVDPKKLHDIKVAYKKIISQKKYTNKNFKNIEEFVEGRDGELYIRCHGKKKDGDQCNFFAAKRSIFCKLHSRKNGTKDIVKSQKKTIGVYSKKEEGLLKEELDKINKKPEDEILSILNDVKKSEAVIGILEKQKLYKYKIGDVYNNRKIKTEEEARRATEDNRIKTIKSLQTSIINNASLKKVFFDIQFSEHNTVSKDLFLYVFNKYNAIIQEEVSDIKTLEKIKERIKLVGLEIKDRGYKL
jgi:hypothetical protein